MIISIQSESSIAWPLAESPSSAPLDREYRLHGGSPRGVEHTGFQRGYWTVLSLRPGAGGDVSGGV